MIVRRPINMKVVRGRPYNGGSNNNFILRGKEELQEA